VWDKVAGRYRDTTEKERAEWADNQCRNQINTATSNQQKGKT